MDSVDSVESVVRDVRFALRLCLGAPGFTTVAVLALALGVGANTAIFTIVNAALIERLPFKDPARLVVLWEENAHRPGRPNTVGPMNFVRWKERATSFEGMAGFADTRTNLTGSGNPEELTIQNVTAGFFSVAGVSPAIGRGFTEAESVDRNAAVVVLSHALWLRRFGGDPSIVGRTIQLNGTANVVVGVMPPDVRLLMKSNSLVGKPIDLWAPWVLPASARDARGRYMSVLARLSPGASLDRAQTEMTAVAAATAAELPDVDTGWTVRVLSIRDELAGDLRPALLMLAGAVAFVLLIACANVANLLLARGAVRQREMAIRAAVGAGRGRLARQLFTEVAVLGAAGGLAGLVVAQASLKVLAAASPIDLAQFGPVRLNYAVLAFTALISLLTAIVCGFAPAFEGGRADVQESLKDGGHAAGAGLRHRRLRQAFVVAEIALAVVLLVGAGLMIRSFGSLRSVDPGMDTRDVLTLRVALPFRKYNTPDKALQFFDQAVKKVATLPGVRSAGMISYLPFASLGAATAFTIVGQPPPPPGQDFVTDVSVCDNGYFQTLRLPLVRGRWFTDRELHETSNVVIINEALARRYFPGADPLGKSLVINMNNPNVPTAIVGVVGSSKFTSLESETRPATYWPHPQLAYTSMTLTVRTGSDPAPFAPIVEREIQSIDPDQPVSDVRTMEQWVERTIARERFSSFLLLVFASLAMLLAAMGIYGVMSYAVSQRTPEIGIRVALGAGRRDITRLIVGNGARLTAIGLGIGVALALALGRAIASLLFETTSADPPTFAAVVLLLGGVAVFASYVPARRAARIAPTEALRHQ
ncbi:MAG TPA: ABC transporter permease [Vicinamibacterales bacterium]|nr:ABC transporter permease [Vicinamibacterales bacterium]